MGVIDTIISDVRAVRGNDPAAANIAGVVLNHTPLHSIIVHRIVHELYTAGIPIIPRFIANIGRFWTGVEIHPGAKIGRGFFIDHGMGVVIGETAEIGDNCMLFQNVSLGGTGKHHVKRHPTLGSNVLVGAGSILLGPIKVGNNAKIGANTFIIMHDVPADTTVVGVPGRIVRENGKKTRKELSETNVPKGFV